MEEATVTIRTSSGRDPEEYFVTLAQGIVPTVGDAMFAAEMHKARILERTGRGVDVEGMPFAPYSTEGPYYYYPSKTAQNRKTATSRTFKKVEKAGGAGAVKTGSGLGIKFEGGYAAFKSWLGRWSVDLRGARAPHMLQSLTVHLPNGESSASAPAESIAVGIWGEAAGRASAHNQGNAQGGLPQRRFIGASERDLAMFASHLLDRVLLRLRLRRAA